MTVGEAAYLVLVIAAFVVFAVTLAWVSRPSAGGSAGEADAPASDVHTGQRALY